MESQALQISIRELKARPAFAIARARAGVTVQITSHRKTVAQIVAAESPSEAATRGPVKRKSARDAIAANSGVTTRDVLERLHAAGVQVTEASQTINLGRPIALGPSPDGKTMSDLMLDMRGLR